MRIERRGWRFWFALAATWLFLVQSAAGSVAFAGASVPLDAFGNPLCLGSDGHDLSKNTGGGHDTQPSCCSLACGAAGTALGTPPEGVSLLLRIATGKDSGRRLARFFFIAADEHDPGSPRAPPATA